MEDSRGTLCRIDVSLERSSVCVVDGRGKIVKEAKVASEPEALVLLALRDVLRRMSKENPKWASRVHGKLLLGFESLRVSGNRLQISASISVSRTSNDQAAKPIASALTVTTHAFSRGGAGRGLGGWRDRRYLSAVPSVVPLFIGERQTAS
jgi:hypothetical protein